MTRDALWVLPNGVTAVVTVDDEGNLIEDAPETSETQAEPPLAPKPVKAPDPPPQQHRHRGRRNRR